MVSTQIRTETVWYTQGKVLLSETFF